MNRIKNILRIAKKYKIDATTSYLALKRNNWDRTKACRYIERNLKSFVFKIFTVLL